MAVDPKNQIKKRINDIKNRDADMDVKEKAERHAAAKASVKENEKHFVSFLEDMVDNAVQSVQDIRREQDECWDVYNEVEPKFYKEKDEWQSRVIMPKPFSAVQFAGSVVRKAFEVQFLSVTNKSNKDGEKLWQELLPSQLGRHRGKFPIRFTDAAMMGFAIGTSMEMIPQWIPGKGLNYSLVEPWKIHRDPDALSRDPQSGMFWVHQEWLDYHLLKFYEGQKRYKNVGGLSPLAAMSSKSESPYLTKEEIARRKNQTWSRSKFRNALLVSEFWGTLLDPKGEILMPNCTYTTCAGRVIQEPEVSPYKTLRWPGMAFSPLPNLLRFDGRGLLQGVKTLWHFMCGLLCLHADNLNWNVNPPVEINVQALVQAADTEWFPGKQYHVKDTISGQQAIRTVDRKGITGDVLANLNFAAQNFDKGSLVHEVTQGLPGYRGEAPTARGQAQDLEQSMTVFGLIGKNLEDGALSIIEAGGETIAANISYAELVAIVGEELAAKFQDGSDLGCALPPLTDGDFDVSGISAMMRDWEIVKSIREVILPLFESELFIPYGRPYALWQSLERRLNLKDEGILIDEEKAKLIDAAQQAIQEARIIGEATTLEAATNQANAATDQANADAAAAAAAAQPPAPGPKMVPLAMAQ